MTQAIPTMFLDMLEQADVAWRPVLQHGLAALARADPAYLPALAKDAFLPTEGRLFNAFVQPLEAVRYVLVGEGPYPRAESATGVCFMDGAVGSLWSPSGLSKPVNRATSLRNFMKMLLVAEGSLQPGDINALAMARIALTTRAIGSPTIQTLQELQANLLDQGFLLLNAALVFRQHVPPALEAKAWQPFQQVVLAALAEKPQPPTLVLWGKIAGQLSSLPAHARFPKAIAEHPYNLSFIENSAMQALFRPMSLLRRRV